MRKESGFPIQMAVTAVGVTCGFVRANELCGSGSQPPACVGEVMGAITAACSPGETCQRTLRLCSTTVTQECQVDSDCPGIESCVLASNTASTCACQPASKAAAGSVCGVNNGTGTFVAANGEVIDVLGGQLSGAGATLFVDFFRAPASTNDWIDVDGDGESGNLPFFPFTDQLAEQFTAAQNRTVWWLFQYRSVGSVNGFNEFVQNQLCGTIPTSIPAEAGLFNQFQYATSGSVSGYGIGANRSGTPIEPCEINFSFLDVPSAWAVQVGPPASANWDKAPTEGGYGLNPIKSSSGYDSALQSLSRECYPGGPTVSLNTNTGAPNQNTIYDFIGAWVPVAFIANRGTGAQNVKYSEMQHLFAAGRMPSGENLVGGTRSVGSGTRNAIMNSIGVDTSWGRGDNVGNEFLVAGVANLGPNHQSVNAAGSTNMETAVQARRLAIGTTGLAAASRAAADAIAGNYEILNVCKDVDTNGNPVCNCDQAHACPAGPLRCSISAATVCTVNGDCPPGEQCVAIDAAAPNSGYVRPTINTVLDNCDACCGYTIGGNGSFVSRGDPFEINSGNPEYLEDRAVADYLQNISDSVDSFAGNFFPGECNVSEVCSVKRCSAGTMLACTGTGTGNCGAGNGNCNFIVCDTVTPIGCPVGFGTCGYKPCSVDGDCPDMTCSDARLECPNTPFCAGMSAGTCVTDFCRAKLNMPGDLLARSFFLPQGLDCLQSNVDGMVFAPNPVPNQALQNTIRSINGLGINSNTPNYGAVNEAGRAPVRKTGILYSDGQGPTSILYVQWTGSIFQTIAANARLARRNRLQGDTDRNCLRNVADAAGLAEALYSPRTWQQGAAALNPGGGCLGAADAEDQVVDRAIPEAMLDFDGDGSLTKEDLRYFADGLALEDRCCTSGTNAGAPCNVDTDCRVMPADKNATCMPCLDRKAGAVAIDNAIIALGRPIPWADTAVRKFCSTTFAQQCTVDGDCPGGETCVTPVPGDPRRNLVIPAASISVNPTFITPKDVNLAGDTFLATGKPYKPGDFMCDISGDAIAQTCVLGPNGRCSFTTTTMCTLDSNCPSGEVCLVNECSLSWLPCTSDGDCPALARAVPGAEPRGWDGKVNAKDLDYIRGIIRAGNGNWSNLDQAVRSDLSADMNGDLKVDQADVDQCVGTVLQTFYGDVNLDGVVNAADRSIIVANQASLCNLTAPPRCGWAAGDVDGDGDVDADDLELVGACDATVNVSGIEPSAGRVNTHLLKLTVTGTASAVAIRCVSIDKPTECVDDYVGPGICNQNLNACTSNANCTFGETCIRTLQSLALCQPLASWSTVYLTSPQIATNSNYVCWAECCTGLVTTGLRSFSDSQSTGPYGELEGPGVVDITDVIALLDAYAGVGEVNLLGDICTGAGIGCSPDGICEIADVGCMLSAYTGSGPYLGECVGNCP